MKPPVYDPSIRDAHPRDLIARGLTAASHGNATGIDINNVGNFIVRNTTHPLLEGCVMTV